MKKIYLIDDDLLSNSQEFNNMVSIMKMKTSSHKHQIKLGIVITNKTLQEDNEKKLVALNDS